MKEDKKKHEKMKLKMSKIRREDEKKLRQIIFDVLSLSKDKHKQANYTRLNAANKYNPYIYIPTNSGSVGIT